MSRIYVRALEPEDLEFFYQVENSIENWRWGSQNNLLSRYDLKRFIDSSHQNIFESGQKRFAVCDRQTDQIIGSLDLFDFDLHSRRIAVGMIIYDPHRRGAGVGQEMLDWAVKFCFEELSLHQIYAEIQSSNIACLSLFTKYGFSHCGTKKDWILHAGEFQSVESYQLISEK